MAEWQCSDRSESGLTEIVAVAGAQSLNHETRTRSTVTVLPLTLDLLSFHYARVFDESLKGKLESKLEPVLINSHLVTSSETQGRSVGPGEKARQKFSSLKTFFAPFNPARQ